jgi:hypothetical protein
MKTENVRGRFGLASEKLPLGMRGKRIMFGFAVVSVIAAYFLAVNPVQATPHQEYKTATWAGTTGPWNTSSNWSPSGVPNNGYGNNSTWYSVLIDNGKTGQSSVVNLNIDADILGLTINSGDTLNIQVSKTLKFVEYSAGQSAIVNNGAMNIAGTLNNTTASVLALTSSGGTVGMQGGTLTGSTGFSNANILTGYGLVSAALTNSGTITATSPDSTARVLKLTGAYTNSSGTIGANTNATLDNATSATITSTRIVMGGGTLDSTNGQGYASADLSGFGFIARPFNSLNGSITASGGTLKFQTLATLTGANVLNVNAGAIFDNATGGALTFPTVNMLGGTLAASSGSYTNTGTNFSGWGTISGALTNNGTITANNATPITLSGSFTLNGGSLAATGNGSFTNQGTLSGHGTIAAPLTNSNTISVTGGDLSVTRTLTNNGTISIESSRKFVVDGFTFDSSGGTVNGVGTTEVLNGGKITGTGAFGSVTVTNGILSGTHSIVGNLAIGSQGTVEVLSATMNSSTPILSGISSASLGGTLDLNSLNGLFTNYGDYFWLLTTSTGVSGAFAITGDPDGAGPLFWKAVIQDNGLKVSAVPIPSSLILISSGIVGLIAIRRRKQVVGKFFG